MQGGTTPLFIASQNGHLEAVLFLLSDAGADKDIAMQAWFIAPQQLHLEVVCLLYDAGADKGIADQGDATPYFVASESGQTTSRYPPAL